MMIVVSRQLLLLALSLCPIAAFLSVAPQHPRPSVLRLAESSSTNDVTALQQYLQTNHAIFSKLLMERNADVWKQLSAGALEEGITIFAVTDEAMQTNVGASKLAQLEDVRNEEAVFRMGAFHCINECVSSEELFNSGGVVTLAETVPIERGVTGGLFGLGGKEDGSVTIGGRAKILETVYVAPNQVVHRVDDMVSPSILWRYFDQLRIPGSK